MKASISRASFLIFIRLQANIVSAPTGNVKEHSRQYPLHISFVYDTLWTEYGRKIRISLWI
ncbi:hypothetical protein BACCAP_01294 [Pseudoflavonifractor capillosus ATCC 29799]|uniref:Uncharacterized protein n=1 Tax=Pseudoflavonifractor capillosus ATCC 29799 TaxID=411467 RepID=A6NSW6_9FIRM|nr:hypothetical protein BACCAP_01294 [Pseudoflavonifractor capillosus ATCC 29799]